MTRKVPVLVAFTALTLMLAAPLWAQNPWIHVRVENSGKKASKVHVNLPLSVVQAVLEVAPEKIVSKGRIHLDHHDTDLSVSDLRRLWTELKATGEAELVSIEEDDQTVTVSRQGELFVVRVDSPSEKHDVHVEVPVGVVDALLSGEGEELNIKDALEQLKGLRGDIVRVTDDETTVRIWIDEG